MAFLTSLSPEKQLAFALLVFERMLPGLMAFSKDTGRDASCYLKARDAAWNALQNGKDAMDGRSLNEACLKNAPDTEEFSHELTSCALNAALTMSDILEFTGDHRSEHMTYVATLATDSVYLYLSSRNTSVVEPEEAERIAVDPLMQREVRQQKEDVRFLSGLPDTFDRETISALKTRAKSQPPLI